ncbi:MAG: hypothetical protein FJ405_10000, partial [Verrucomicrobia bacterium]|nr:hypothetical protein [Verrucomicrobiota bacterium]
MGEACRGKSRQNGPSVPRRPNASVPFLFLFRVDATWGTCGNTRKVFLPAPSDDVRPNLPGTRELRFLNSSCIFPGTSARPRTMNYRRNSVSWLPASASLLTIVSLLILLLTSPAHAGRYGPQGFSFGNGAVPGLSNWTELVTLESRTPGEPPIRIASVQSNALRLTLEGYFNTVTDFKVLDLDPLQDIVSFTATYAVRMQATNNAPGRGIALSFGKLPEGEGDGELDYSIPGGLVVSLDSSINPEAGKTEGEIVVYVNRAKFASYPQPFVHDSAFRTNTVKWDVTNGLEIAYAGRVVVSKLAIPGFVPRIGDRFAISARTGDAASQTTVIDNLRIDTIPSSLIPSGGPIITEFVADNRDFEDDFIETPDWIEIYNGGPNTNLAGWFLTNERTNLTKWPLPSLTLQANRYQLVFASGRDLRATNAQLHANFSLQRESGYLALVRPDGTIASEFQYGPQEQNVAYGEIGASRQRGYLDLPTPGRKNVSNVGDAPPAETVRFTRRGGIIMGTTPGVIEIQPLRSTNAIVRFTLNNTIPTESSPVWGGSLSVTNTTTVRARTFEPGLLPGPVRSITLLKVDASISSFAQTQKPFESSIPILVMDSFGADIDGGSRQFSLSFATSFEVNPATGRASISDAPDFQGRTGIHVRGESSSGFGQKSYALEMWDEFNLDRDDGLLGMPAESDWVLHGPWSEKTLMRNHLIYQTMQEIRSDYSGPRTRFVEVFLNEGRNQPVSYADYKGVYLLVEKIKHSQNRLDIGKLNALVTDSNLLTGGYVFKKDKASTGVTQFNTQGGIDIQLQDPETLTPPMLASLRGYLNSFELALNGPNSADPVRGYAAWIDVGSFIDAQLYVEISKQVDGYVFSTYFNKPRGGKVFAGPTWDFNIALGNADYGTGDTPRGWLYNGSDTEPLTGGLWYGRLQQDPEHKLKFFDRYFQLRRGVWGTSNIYARIDGIVDTLLDGSPMLISNNMPITVQSPAARHYRKHAILGQYHWPNAPGVEMRRTFQSEIAHLKKFLLDRLSWMDDQYQNGSSILRPPTLSHPGGAVQSGFALSIEAYTGVPLAGKNYPSGVIYYTTDGSDPRPAFYPIPRREERVLIPEFALAKYLVPTTGNGGASAKLEDWTARKLGPTASGLAWVEGKLGLGYDTTNSPFYRYIGGGNYRAGDIQAAMQNQSSTVFIRVPFEMTAEDLEQAVDLSLKIRFDDGFIAYLNGVEVARGNIRSNTPAEYDMVANQLPQAWGDTTAALQRDLNLSRFIGELRVGANTLAILGANSNRVDADAIFSPRLAATVSIPPNSPITSTRYAAPIAVNGAMRVKARMFANGLWSPMTEASFVPDGPPATVRINEWMASNVGALLDPADTPPAPDDWFELFNPAATPA